jgi:hypothetical protein
MKSPDDAHFQKWEDNPEPMKHDGDGGVILDTNLQSTAWLWDVYSETTAYLIFHGDTYPVKR